VEGIEKDHKDLRQDDSRPTDVAAIAVASAVSVPQDVTVPLTVSLDKPGTYLYALEEVTDGVGNTIRVETDPISSESVSASATATTRSFIVLQKPTISFAYCSSDMPTSLLIGSEARLNLDPTYLDNFDKPWDIQIQYQPPTDDASGRQLKTWKKALKYDGEHRGVSLNANAPGDYKVVGFKGKVSEFRDGLIIDSHSISIALELSLLLILVKLSRNPYLLPRSNGSAFTSGKQKS
jgi:nucleoporin POM152